MNIKKMIELKKEFTRKGIAFKQVYHSDKVIVYQLSRTHCNGTRTTWFEVLRIRIGQPDRFHDDEWEMYGSDEECGRYYWSCSNVDVVRKVINREFQDVNCDEICDICYAVTAN